MLTHDERSAIEGNIAEALAELTPAYRKHLNGRVPFRLIVCVDTAYPGDGGLEFVADFRVVGPDGSLMKAAEMLAEVAGRFEPYQHPKVRPSWRVRDTERLSAQVEEDKARDERKRLAAERLRNREWKKSGHVGRKVTGVCPVPGTTDRMQVAMECGHVAIVRAKNRLGVALLFQENGFMWGCGQCKPEAV
jgi:hypothetical protein